MTKKEQIKMLATLSAALTYNEDSEAARGVNAAARAIINGTLEYPERIPHKLHDEYRFQRHLALKAYREHKGKHVWLPRRKKAAAVS